MINTKFNEECYTTNDIDRMANKYLAEDLKKGWVEDFVDENNGEIVSIERTEILYRRGVLLTGDTLAEIMFYLQSGEITEVSVSNQRREGFILKHTSLDPFTVNATIEDKKYKFILYASTVDMAIAIVKDFIELNYKGSFYITAVKTLDYLTIIEDTLVKKDNKEESKALSQVKKFYQIEINIIYEEFDTNASYIVKTTDVNKAMILIRENIKNTWIEKGDEVPEFKTVIEAVKPLPLSSFIEMDFSLAYLEEYKK